jgi:UrcA family protein
MSLPTLRWSLLGFVSLASAAPVLAQPAPQPPPPPPEEIVIVGHYGRVPDNADSVSLTVGYADLDLSNPVDRDILRHRIALTARFLCRKLGEPDISTPGEPSCREQATQDALRRVGTIEANFAPRGTAWVRPPPWVPPYPTGWMQQYP